MWVPLGGSEAFPTLIEENPSKLKAMAVHLTLLRLK